MNDEELKVVFEELGDCLEDMARAVDRMKSLQRKMFRAVQELTRKQNDIAGRVQCLEDINAAKRLEDTSSGV